MTCPLCGSDNVFIKIDLEGKRWILRCFEDECKREFNPPVFDGYYGGPGGNEDDNVS